MRPRLTCCCWGFAIAAGLAWLIPANTAQAQYSYGYDSLAYEPTAQTYWYNSGYQSVYTDPSTGSFVNGGAVPNRTVAPYVTPPYGEFSQRKDLPLGPSRPSFSLLRQPAVSAESEPAAAQRVTRQRRGLILRRRR